MKIAIVGAGSSSGEQGGAENFYKGLCNALGTLNVDTDLLCPVSDETGFDAIKETYLRFYDLDLSKYDGVISTKAPAYLVRHPNHVCYLQHTMRVFYDMFEVEFPFPTKELIEQRTFIQELDIAALQYPRTKQVFTIGNEVKNRLMKYNGIESEVLYQGLLSEHYKEGAFEYVFMPGRLHRWKRVDLVIRAMQYVQAPVKLIITGIGEDEAVFRKLACEDLRIEFRGRVSDETMIELYANALCVPFVPLHEDFGLITLEAFRSGKPVITCTDSGEPAYIVQDNNTGFVCEPDPRDIAGKIEYFVGHPDIAKEMGKKGKISTNHIKWDTTAVKLLTALAVAL